jgi:hypothetical protein
MRHHLRQNGTKIGICLALMGLMGCGTSGGGSSNNTAATTPGSNGVYGSYNNVNGNINSYGTESVGVSGELFGQSFVGATAFVVQTSGEYILVLTNENVSPCQQFPITQGAVSINIFLPANYSGYNNGYSNGYNNSNLAGSVQAPVASFWNPQTGSPSNWISLQLLTFSLGTQGQSNSGFTGTLQLSDGQGGSISGSFSAYICNGI